MDESVHSGHVGYLYLLYCVQNCGSCPEVPVQ